MKKPKTRQLVGSITRPADLEPELRVRMEQLSQRYQSVSASTVFAVGRTADGAPIELELLSLMSPLKTPAPEAAKASLREIAQQLSTPPPPAPKPRFPKARDDWKEVIANELGLRRLIDASPVKGLLNGESHCEAFADALFSPDALLKVKGSATVAIFSRERLRGKLQDFNLVSPHVFKDIHGGIKARPYQVLVSTGGLDVQARRISFIARSFSLAAVVLDGHRGLEGWFKTASDDERKELLCQWSTIAGNTMSRPWSRLPDSFRRDVSPNIAYRLLESAGIHEVLDRPRGRVKEGFDRRQLLVYLSP